MLVLFREWSPVRFRSVLWYLFSIWLWPWCLACLLGLVGGVSWSVAGTAAALFVTVRTLCICFVSRQDWMPLEGR